MHPGTRLDKLRIALNLSKSQMAEEIGLEQGSFSDIIRGKTKGISNTILKIVEILYAANIEYLNFESDEMFRKDLKPYKAVQEIKTIQEPHADYKSSPKQRTDLSKQFSDKDWLELQMLRELVELYRKSNLTYEKLLKEMEEKKKK